MEVIMKQIKKYMMMALLTCSMLQTVTINGSDKSDKAADAAGNVIVRLSRASGLSNATNASIVATTCAVGAFMIYRWCKNSEITALKKQVEDLTSKHERKKDLVLKLLLKPEISKIIQEHHLSYNPRKTGAEVEELFTDIITTFLSQTKVKASATASEYAAAMIETLARPEVAKTLSKAVGTAIDVSTGEYTKTQSGLEDIETLKHVITRLRRIITEPSMKRRIESIYPDRCKDSWKATKVIRWMWQKSVDSTVGR